MPQNFYELVWIFIIYAFIGWCTEVSYAALDTGKFVNRGFLNGPYCPIYGCGVVIVVAGVDDLKDLREHAIDRLNRVEVPRYIEECTKKIYKTINMIENSSQNDEEFDS